jgi:putative intracellular protease/amidase
MTSPAETDQTFNIGIFIYDQVEELDFVGPFETMKSTATFRRHNDMRPDWRVFIVAEEPGIVKTSGDLLIQPHFSFQDHPHIDLLILPGGHTGLQLERPTVIEWV